MSTVKGFEYQDDELDNRSVRCLGGLPPIKSRYPRGFRPFAAIPAPVSHQRTQPAPTSSAAAGGTSVPGSGAEAVHAAGTSWLTEHELLIIEHD